MNPSRKTATNWLSAIGYRLILGVLVSVFALQAQSACIFFDDFKDNNDGTVTDPRNGVIWKRCVEGFTWSGNACEGSEKRVSWYDAMRTAKESRFLNKSDWRVPTRVELEAVMGKDCINNRWLSGGEYAASKVIAHPVRSNGHSGDFWSSSPKDNSDYPFTANFNYGSFSYERREADYGFHVRLVRSSQSSGNEGTLEFNNEYKKIPRYELQSRRFHAANSTQNNQIQSSNIGRGGLRELVWLDGTKMHAARCNNGNSDVFERTALGQYCAGSSADGYKCFSTPSLTAQHICK